MDHRLLAGFTYFFACAIVFGIYYFFKRDTKYGWKYNILGCLLGSVIMKFIADPLYYEYKSNQITDNCLSSIQQYYPDVYSKYKSKIVGPSDQEAGSAIGASIREVLPKAIPLADDKSLLNYYKVYNKINKSIYPIDHNFPYFRELGYPVPALKNISADLMHEYYSATNQLIISREKNKYPQKITNKIIDEASIQVSKSLRQKYKPEDILQVFSDFETGKATGNYNLKSQIIMDFIDSVIKNGHIGALLIKGSYSQISN